MLPIGGVPVFEDRFEKRPPRLLDDVMVALAGPVVSLLIAAVACLVVAQIVGLIGLRKRLNLTASLAVVLLLGAALTLGVVGGLEVLPR